MKRSHKIVSLLLVLALCLGLSVTAYAEGSNVGIAPCDINYGDGTWQIYYIYTNIYGESRSGKCTTTIYTSTDKSSVTSKCTSFYSVGNSSGTLAYAQLKLTYTDQEGETHTITSSYTHRQEGSRTFSAPITMGSVVKGVYTPAGATSNYYSLAGSLSF